MGATDFLTWTIGAQSACAGVADGPAAPSGHGLLGVDGAFVEEVVDFLANHFLMKGTVFWSPIAPANIGYLNVAILQGGQAFGIYCSQRCPTFSR